MIRAIVVSIVLGATTSAAAQLAVELRLPEALHVGDRVEVVALVRGAASHPLLLTPRSEGAAVEVVRGRLMRADARQPDAEELEFRIPIVAREAGTAVLRVRASGYVCEARCRAVDARASLVVRVAPAIIGQQKSKQAETSEPRTSSLSWVRLEGAEICIASAALARAIEEQLDRHVFVSAADASLAVEGRVERADDRWRAVIAVVDGEGQSLGERTLESGEESCDQLGSMIAVAIALMIDPLTAPDPDPGPDPDPDPDPDPVVIIRRVEVPVPAEPDPGQAWRFEVDAALVGSVGLVPTPMIGGLSTVILRAPNFVPVAIEGALYPFSRAEPANGHADFLHVHAGLQICPLWFRENGLALHACLGADAGAVIVVGGDLEIVENERLIGQGHVAIRGHWDVIGPLTVRAGLHLLVPFRHEPFIATVGGMPSTVYTPEPIAGMLDIGLGIHAD